MAHQYYKYQQYPVGSYRFYIEIGNRQIGFQKVSGINLLNRAPKISNIEVLGKKEPEYYSDSLREMGEDSAKTNSSKTEKDRTLTLEKAILAVSDKDDVKEEQSYLFSLLNEDVKIEKITLLVPTGMNLDSAWLLLNFTECYLTSYTLSELDATNSTGYLKQTLTFKYRNVAIEW